MLSTFVMIDGDGNPMLSWKITPFDLAAVGHGLTDAFTSKLLRKGLLPEGEDNDRLILAEKKLERAKGFEPSTFTLAT